MNGLTKESVITRIITSKIEKGINPPHATLSEIAEHFNEDVWDVVKDVMVLVEKRLFIESQITTKKGNVVTKVHAYSFNN